MVFALLVLAVACDQGSAAGSFATVDSCSDIARGIAEAVAGDRFDATGRVDASQRVNELGCDPDLVQAAAVELTPTDPTAVTGDVTEPSDPPDPASLDTGPLEDEIRAGIREGVVGAGIDIRAVTCPTDVVAEAGQTFECTVDGSDGSTGIVTVEQGENGAVTWELTDVELPD